MKPLIFWDQSRSDSADEGDDSMDSGLRGVAELDTKGGGKASKGG